MKTAPDPDPELLEQLRIVTALDNPVRLKAYLMIRATPGIPFNEIADRLGIETGLAAYHVGVLKAVDLVEVSFVRTGRALSSYRLTERGEAVYEMLLGAKKAHRAGPGRQQASRARRPQRPTPVVR